MKLLIRYLLLLSPLFFSFQDPSLKDQVDKLLQEAKAVHDQERLRLLDSATWLVWEEKGFPYDSIANLTIAQAYKLDSLELAMSHTGRVMFYLANRVGRPKAAKQLFQDLLDKNLNIQNDLYWFRIYLYAGDSYYEDDDLTESLNLFQTSGTYAMKMNDSLRWAITLKRISDTYAQMGNFAKANTYLTTAEKVYIAKKDTIKITNTRNSRANLYSRIGFFDEAKKERDEMLVIAKAIKNYTVIIPALLNAAIDDRKTGDYASRIQHLKKALDYAKKSVLEDFYEPQITNSLLYSYAQTDSLEKAKAIYSSIQKNPERYTKEAYEDQYTEANAHYQLAIGNYNKAIILGEKYLKLKTDSKDFEDLFAAHDFLHKAYDKVNNIENAFFHYKQASKLKEDILSNRGRQALAYYQTLYETEKRDFKIASQQSDIAMLDEKNHAKQQLIIFGGAGLVLLFTIIYLWRSRYFAKRKQRMQMTFAQDLIKGQEEERFRIARELHDSVGQKLVLLKKKTNAKRLEDMQDLTGSTLDELRTILEGLRPEVLERLGVTKALESLIHQVDEHSEPFFTAEIEDIDGLINKDNALHLYRIIQESLNNIVKHAEAQSVSVTIEDQPNAIKAIITDNGKGFAIAEKLRKGTHLGMKTLMERAKIMKSKIDIISAPNKGTSIELMIPKL